MSAKTSIVVPGNLDGVHLGHQSLIDEANRLKRTLDADRSVALFFDPHPAFFFNPERAPAMLTSVDLRRKLLLAHGIDSVDVRRFDSTFAKQSAASFVEDLLIDELNIKAIIVGADFRFGHQRSGTIETLREAGDLYGFKIVVGPTMKIDDRVVSSTRVRETLSNGDVAAAAQLLGRRYAIEGSVVKGHQRGRKMGFPTANISVDSRTQIPSDGVYICEIQSEKVGKWRGVTNIGSRPTFAAGRSIECHLLDFAGDIYGERVTLEFYQRIRGEMKFDGIDTLVAQIRNDVQTARLFFGRM